MNKRSLLKLVSLLLLLTLALTACGPQQPDADITIDAAQIETAVAEASAATAIAQSAADAAQPTTPPADAATEDTTAVDPTTAPPVGSINDCLSTTGDRVQFVHPGHGYCLQVLSGFVPSASDSAVSLFTGVLHGESEYVAAQLRIVVAPANGRTTQSLANEAAAAIGVNETPSPITLGGQEGLLLKKSPGRFSSTTAYLVHNDLAYVIAVEPLALDIPAPNNPPEADATAIWNLMVNSLRFFEPQAAAVPTANTSNCTVDAKFIADNSVPDGTVVQPGETVIKRWLLQNIGTCDWGLGFEIFQTNANSSAFLAVSPGSSPLPLAAPNETVEVHVFITIASNAQPGDHIAEFSIRTNTGLDFGTNPFALVKVEGSGSSATSTPVASASPTPNAGLSTTKADCPTPDQFDYWYTDDWVGVCIVHNLDRAVVESRTDDRKLVVTLPNEANCTACDAIDSVLEIWRYGNVGGLSLQDFANQQIATWDTSIIQPVLSNTTIGGNPAIMAGDLGLPGIFGVREAYVIANGVGYVITWFPEDYETELWIEIVESQIVFFK